MFSRLLVANRGEVAVRILRACAELGIETVAVYSEADAGSKYLEFADDAVCIGPPAAPDSYLNIPRIIAAAEITNVDAIHPGYGFLSEKDEFAEICEESNIIFVGPHSATMRKMGNKVEARRIAKENKVPVLPGSEDPIEDDDKAVELAGEIGYPVMIKAAAGGGGGVCASRITRSVSVTCWLWPGPKRDRRSVIMRCMSKRFWKNPVMWKCRFWPMGTVMSSIWANVTVLFRGVIRS